MFRTRRSALLLGVSATLLLSASLVSIEGLPAQAEPPVPTTDPVAAAETIGDRMSVLERATRTAERVEAKKVAAQHKAAKADRAKRIKAREAREAAERKARAEAAAKAQREAEAARSTRTSVRSIAPSSGSTREIGQRMAAARGWTGAQWTCLNNLWTKESGWRTTAQGYTGAYGIPQALPGSKMASAGADWRTNPATQIEWGLNYIGGRYGTPCGAWNAFLSKGWY